MKRFALILSLVGASALAQAGPVPTAIKARYQELKAVMNKVDFESFKTFFSPDFVNVDPKGTVSKYDDFMNSVKPLFDGATKGDAREKLISATTKDGVVSVSFDFKYSIISPAGTTRIHEVGVDSWKQVDGKWLFVKTVDKSFTVKMPKPKK